MKILNFGSLNIDHTYRLPRRILPGETVLLCAVFADDGELCPENVPEEVVRLAGSL